jgi:ABC-type branched-subunit amino acid transport system ATPase component
VKFVASLCESVTVLDFGEVIASGPPREVFSDPRVIEVYVGS